MIKKIALYLFTFFFINNVVAQQEMQSKIDSLMLIVKSTDSDSVKYKNLTMISQMYWSINPPKGISIARQALSIALQTNKDFMIAEANGILGMNYLMIQKNDSGQYFLEQSLKVAQKIKDQKLIGLACGALGNLHYFKTNYPLAIDYYLKSHKAAEAMGNRREEAAALSNIGSVYSDLNETEKALPYFEKALQINKAINFKIYQAVNLSNIANIYSKKKNYKKALSYNFQALCIDKEIDEMSDVTSILFHIGGNYLSLQMLDSALYYSKSSLVKAMELNSVQDIALAQMQLAEVFSAIAKNKNVQLLQKEFEGNKLKCLKTAQAYTDTCEKVFIDGHNIYYLSKIYFVRSEIERQMGNCDAALAYFEKYKSNSDSIFNEDVQKQLTQKAMQYDFDKKEAKQKAVQEKKDNAQRIIRNAMAAGLTGALIFSVIVFRQRNKISSEKKRSEELLLNILPAEVAEELKTKGSADAQLIDEVTVLFTDFKGFTQLSEKLTPKELVAEINECFSAFDHIMEKHGVEKIKTIGDAYMAAGGLPTANNTHAENVVNAALDIQTFMQEHKTKKMAANELFFEIRIGVHTGPVVAGIVGVKKFAYDIWGDTVNTASRMESSGEVGKVNISGTTYAFVKDKFNCIHRGKVQAKGKGEIDMYFVQ